MIRLLIAVVGLFIIWMLFFSTFSKQRKALLVGVSLALGIFGLWYESGANKPRAKVVKIEQVVSCGVSAKHSYRSNFDIELCIENTANTGNIKRVELAIIAQQCDAQNNCIQLQEVIRSLAIDLPASSKTTLTQNLNFDKVSTNQDNVAWSFRALSVKANK